MGSRRLGLILLPLLILTPLEGCRISVNFHEIDPGRYYRSAQLSGAEFSEAFERYGIRSVINLRGAVPGADWYDAELEAVRRHGVELVSIPMSANRLPHRRDLVRLIEAFERMPRPILLHCMAGVDRTGEASAVYLMEYMGKSREQALEMLSSKFLYLPFFKPAKAYFIREVYQGKEWALRSYDPCQQKYEHYDQAAFCPEPPDSPTPSE